jgi:homoserine O-acetyltransferase
MSGFEAYMTFSTEQNPGLRSSAVEIGSGATSCREGLLRLEAPLKLHHGDTIDSLQVGWRLVGPEGAPLVLLQGGISAHRRVVAAADEQKNSGWWSEVVGTGLALPAEKYRILSFDYLGGSGDTSGPRAGRPFPSISTYDQAQVLLHILDHLRLEQLNAIVGASYGGMVGLAFAERHPERVAKLIVISAADRTSPMSTAWRSVQRRVVRFGIDVGEPAKGLELARALAMATYRSAEEFSERFDRAPQERDGRFIFPVEDYLMARGADYAQRYQPDSFLTLSESIDLHRIDVGRVPVPVTAIAVQQDQLVPIADMRAMCARLPKARLHEISSVFGHDAFLKESEVLGKIFASELPAAP